MDDEYIDRSIELDMLLSARHRRKRWRPSQGRRTAKMSQRSRKTVSYKCATCGHVFNVAGASDGSLALSDRPVSGGIVPDGNSMGAEGVVMVVVAKGPENLADARDEWPAVPCPRCGRLN
jgi:predicted RNA-binding Zn-ribbon protein involved in translation (DUF1610 family)